MSTYSIRDLEKLSGIKAHTIRIWEQRYHLIKPQRTNTNIRYYSDDDLIKLMNVSVLNQNGYKISKISQLADSQICEVVFKLNSEVPSLNTQTESLVMAMIEVDERHFNQVFDKSVESLGFEITFEQLLFPFLERIGVLWLSSTINPAQEHFITNLVRQKLIAAIDNEGVKTEVTHPRILFYLPEGEFHEIGLLYYNYLARKADFEVLYLGSSVPFRDIVRVDEIRPAQILFTSFVMSPGAGVLAEKIKRLKKAFPDKAVLVSGWQVKQEQPRLPENFLKIASSTDFKKAL
ncbi:MAG TPA: MerR family transcriptional regulator, partial [Prolixibacteraceae bacterium]|nr:MerR family transcriptional regulator [Prolixibacteraceae bacterium]